MAIRAETGLYFRQMPSRDQALISPLIVCHQLLALLLMKNPFIVTQSIMGAQG
jgi:hypothetical protein